MKNCEYTRQDIVRYLQSKMTREEESRFQYHLLSCPECEEELRRLRQALLTLEQKEKDPRRWIWALAVACSLAGGIVYLSIRPGTPGQGPGLPPVEIKNMPSRNSIDTLREDTLKIDSCTVEGFRKPETE